MSGDYMKLPASAQEIADVIGSERALYLIGQLPRCYQPDPRYPGARAEHVIMYVPKSLKLDHQLVKILGWVDANKLVQAFGGEILKPGVCGHIYREFRTRSIIRMLDQGIEPKEIAELLEVSERTVRNQLRREIPQEATQAANDNNAAITNARQAAI